MKYRIGITSLGYQCVEHLDKVFAPWREIKKGALSHIVDEVFISTAHGCFHETARLGFPIYSTDGTIEKFTALKNEGVIDNLNVFHGSRFEYEFWNSNLEFLFEKKIDLLFMLNMDEVWEVSEVERLLTIATENPDPSYFLVNFKNYVFDFNTYVKTFIVPRLWRNDKNGGIAGFHFDDELTFKDGKRDKQCTSAIIPFEELAPKHYSWASESKDYLKRKVAFQNSHYHACSYKWDEAKDCLTFNEDYYRMMSQAVPETFKD